MTGTTTIFEHTVSYSLNHDSFRSELETLVCVHGNSSSQQTFLPLFSDKTLGEKFNVLSLDLPGHGASQHFAAAAKDKELYTIDFYAKVVERFVAQFTDKAFSAIGHSLGAHVTTQLSTRVSLKKLINIQNTPLNEVSDLAAALSQDPIFQALFTPEVSEEALLELTKKFSPLPSIKNFVDDFRKTDPYCRLNVASSLTPELDLNEIEKLKSLGEDFTLIIGKNDPFTNMDYIKNLNLNNPVIFTDDSHYPSHKTFALVASLLLESIEP